jgi:hypothetical protein
MMNEVVLLHIHRISISLLGVDFERPLPAKVLLTRSLFLSFVFVFGCYFCFLGTIFYYYFGSTSLLSLSPSSTTRIFYVCIMSTTTYVQQDEYEYLPNCNQNWRSYANMHNTVTIVTSIARDKNCDQWNNSGRNTTQHIQHKRNNKHNILFKTTTCIKL